MYCVRLRCHLFPQSYNSDGTFHMFVTISGLFAGTTYRMYLGSV